MADERLSAESRVHAHQKHHINISDYIAQKHHRSGRIKRHRRFHAGIVNALNGAVKVCACLIVHIHHHSSAVAHLTYISVGIHNHKMHIERLLCNGLYAFDYRKAKRNVMDEHSVHNVAVYPACVAAVYNIDSFGQMSEVSGKNRRCYYHFFFVLKAL